jgi:hypothetical protein
MLDAFLQHTDFLRGCSRWYFGSMNRVFKNGVALNRQLLAELDRELPLGLRHFAPQFL